MKVYLVFALVTVVAVPLVASLPMAGNWSWLPDTDAIAHMEQEFDHARDEPDLVELAWKLGCKWFVWHLRYIFPDLMVVLKSKGPFTIIVPSDEAFVNFDREIREHVKKHFKPVFWGHVMRNRIYSSAVNNDDLVPSILYWDGNVVNVRFNIYDFGRVNSTEIEDEIITATGSIITIKDQNASNGVIHVTDRILYPQPLYDILTELDRTSNPTGKLLAAIEVAGLANAVEDCSSCTLFAPSNRALEALQNPNFNELMADKMMLKDVLLNHFVTAGTYYGAGLRDGKVLYSMNGYSLKITENEGGLHVNNATVFRPDVAVTNGVFHIIDEVLLSPEVKAYYKRKN